MTHFSGLSSSSGLSDVLRLFPRNSDQILRLLDGIMCSDGALSRGEREAIAAFVSEQNTTPYCVFYHTVFSEVFSGSIEATNARIQPLLEYARCLHRLNSDGIAEAFEAVLRSGWTEEAAYEVVEVCGIFDLINTVVLASGIATPKAPLAPYPTLDGLRSLYTDMADTVSS